MKLASRTCWMTEVRVPGEFTIKTIHNANLISYWACSLTLVSLYSSSDAELSRDDSGRISSRKWRRTVTEYRLWHNVLKNKNLNWSLRRSCERERETYLFRYNYLPLCLCNQKMRIAFMLQSKFRDFFRAFAYNVWNSRQTIYKEAFLRSTVYEPGHNWCGICLESLNKRTELRQGCRHKAKFKLSNFHRPPPAPNVQNPP